MPKIHTAMQYVRKIEKNTGDKQNDSTNQTKEEL